MEAANFRAGRFFYHTFINGEGSGWFFNAREGEFGPFSTKLQAHFELELFIQRCIEDNITGGRRIEKAKFDPDEVEEIIAAPPPSEGERISSGSYLEKLRTAVRERASRHLGSREM